MKSHPLTARVAVNRFWQTFFGIGIVATPADFGMQGEWPSHPDVLDWLAVELVESGWDVKHLIKLIVMSDTYRQTSAATPAMLERDPQNRLLARGPRFRLPAELLRDTTLKTSGLLVPRIGGPSVNPYMPGDLWREVSHYGSSPATAQTFVQDHGEKLYRRSLYTFWKRSAPPAFLDLFNAPSRETCTVRRERTNTPLQALATLNDPQFIEAARVLAERVLSATGGNPDAALDRLARRILLRPLEPEELAEVSTTLAAMQAFYREQPVEAQKLVTVGDAKPDPAIAVPQLAAFTMVANQFLNLDEALSK
jgi:hypothetical protein